MVIISILSSYILKSVLIILRIFVVYRPFRFFFTIGLLIFTSGAVLVIRYLWYLFTVGGQGHVQSLVLASILIGIGFQTIIVAFIADLLSVNRRLAEDTRYQLLKEIFNKDNQKNSGEVKSWSHENNRILSLWNWEHYLAYTYLKSVARKSPRDWHYLTGSQTNFCWASQRKWPSW